MHYERAPCFKRLKPDEARPSLRCTCRGYAPLRPREDGTAVAHAVVAGIARRYGQISQEKAFYLEGKTPYTRMIFPSRRQLDESRNQVYRHGRAQGSDRD